MFEHWRKRLRAYAEKDGRGYPDWAVRYLPVVRRLRKQGLAKKVIVEIGANENGLARFLDQRIIALDIDLNALRVIQEMPSVLPVVADMAALPFADRSVDICVCMDAFEHVSGTSREAAAREIMRVIEHDGTAVVGFPSGRAAGEAEERIREAYAKSCGGTLRWLEEHRRMGLPEARSIHDLFHDLARGGYRVTCWGNASLRWWEWMWKVLMCDWPGHGNSVFQVLLRWMTPFLSRRHEEPCYRAMIWIEAGQLYHDDDALDALPEEDGPWNP